MRPDRTTIFIFVSSVALLIVLIIQVNWIYTTAKIKEEIFNDKANLVLSKTAQALSTDTAACRNMEECLGKDEIHKTDSLFNSSMNFYNFHIDYAFEVKKPEGNEQVSESGLKNNVYKKRLEEEATKNGLELNMILPGKKQFLLQEMGLLFITSVILIIIVLVLFWRTIMSLIREKKISEHTTDFLNNMTHEFKTPLTNIALAGKMIGKESSSGNEEKIKHYSGIILEENEKLR
ncbi:MAG: histidine kinase dimerization/phospho-acceptor domain-containing protein, partial [Bacteroidota bacterium]